MTAPADRRRRLLAVTVAVLGTSTAILPPFLVAATAVRMREDFPLTAAGIGAGVCVFFVVMALASRQMGLAVHRFGVSRLSAVGTGCTTASLLLVASAPSWWVVVVGLAVGGVGNAIVHPATSSLLASTVDPRKLGLAFGVKVSGGPGATLVAGLSVTGLAGATSWRGVVGAAAALVLALGVLQNHVGRRLAAPAPASPTTRTGGSAPSISVLVPFGVALAAAAGTAVAALMVDMGVRFAGLGTAGAGSVLTAGSVVGIVVRLGLGWYSDQRPTGRIDGFVVWLPAAGAVGALLLLLDRPAAFVVGALLAYGAGWGWMGVLHHLLARRYPRDTAYATGAVMAGVGWGSAAGPLLLGFVVTEFSYAAAIAAAAALFVASAASMRRGVRRGSS